MWWAEPEKRNKKNRNLTSLGFYIVILTPFSLISFLADDNSGKGSKSYPKMPINDLDAPVEPVHEFSCNPELLCFGPSRI